MQIIDKITRQTLIDDGSLIVIEDEELAKAGVKFPSCVTSNLYVLMEDKPVYESDEARLYDLLYMFTMAAEGKIQAKVTVLPNGEEMEYSFILNDSVSVDASRKVTIKAVVAPGDNLEPTLTFMLPYED